MGHPGVRAKPWSETGAHSRCLHGRKLAIYLRPEEYDVALQGADAAGTSVSRYIAGALRNSTPEMRQASELANRTLLVRLANTEAEVERLRAELTRTKRAAQPEVRIGQRGTTGDLYFSVPEYVVAEAVTWGGTEVESLERELKRTRNRERRGELPKEIGRVQAIVEVFEAMLGQYRTRRRTQVI